MIADLTVAALDNNETYNPARFLNAIQALEAFHRVTRDSKYFDKKQFKALRKAFIEAMDTVGVGERREVLKSKLSSLNTLSLFDRLKELAKELQELVDYKVKEDDLRAIVQLRNSYSHANAHDPGQSLIDLTRICSKMLVVCLGLHIGLPPEIAKSIQNTEWAYYV